MDYEDLISLSTIGDKKTLVDLLSFAEKLCTENKHQESTKVFRDPSIFYRIALNTYTINEPDNSEAYQLNERCKLIKRWIKAHPSGISPLPIIVEGLTPWFIFCTVDYDILNERDTGGDHGHYFHLSKMHFLDQVVLMARLLFRILVMENLVY
ncbi:MAG: hypothetical protein WCG35_11075 [Betaproteobacteria bacterium]